MSSHTVYDDNDRRIGTSENGLFRSSYTDRNSGCAQLIEKKYRYDFGIDTIDYDDPKYLIYRNRERRTVCSS